MEVILYVALSSLELCPVNSMDIYILYMWIYTLFLKEKIFVFQIQLRFINPLKNLRRLGIKMVTDIFLDWESYQFRTEEIDAVFHGAVWPQVNLDFCIVP